MTLPAAEQMTPLVGSRVPRWLIIAWREDGYTVLMNISIWTQTLLAGNNWLELFIRDAVTIFVLNFWIMWALRRPWFRRGTAHELARLAVVIAGPSRAWRGEEFAADLTGRDQATAPSGRWMRITYSIGLIHAALVMRASDLFRALTPAFDRVCRRHRNGNR